jgi:hypothetical protein
LIVFVINVSVNTNKPNTGQKTFKRSNTIKDNEKNNQIQT